MTTVTRIAGVAGSIVQLLLATAGTTQAQELAVSCSTERRIIFPSSTYLDVGKLDVAVATASNLPVILQVSADLCVSATAEVRIAYEIDFGEPKIFGPTNIANHEEFCATRTTMAVIPLPDSNRHFITPVWRVSGAPGQRATFMRGCSLAELPVLK